MSEKGDSTGSGPPSWVAYVCVLLIMGGLAVVLLVRGYDVGATLTALAGVGFVAVEIGRRMVDRGKG